MIYLAIYFQHPQRAEQISIGSILIDIKNPTGLSEVLNRTVSGDIGMPDDSGVSIGCILPVNPETISILHGFTESIV